MNDNSNILTDMGIRILKRRKDLGLSQEELAELADVSPQLLSTAERGAKGLRPENLLKISTALNVSADYLLTGTTVDKDYCILSDKLKAMPLEKAKIVENIIDECVKLSENNKD